MRERKAVLITFPARFAVEEAKELAAAGDYQVVELVTQRYLGKAQFGMGKGKAEEVREMVSSSQAEVLLVDEHLRSNQIYNLAKLIGVEVIDREKLILEIFARRVTTAEAKLQVELAELKYEMPRARDKVRLAKTGEQPGFHGLGKYEVDVYYRVIKRRISTVLEKLAMVRQQRDLHHRQRARIDLPTVSLAGYTGAGKTTLFNLLTGESKEVGSGSFTTLSTSIRSMNLTGSKILLTDTVGFITRLPTYMIEAFKATLEEQIIADLVLLVVDIGDEPDYLVTKKQSCSAILSELGISPWRVLTIYNKSDKSSHEEIAGKLQEIDGTVDNAIVISALTGDGIDRLKSRIANAVVDCVESVIFLDKGEIYRISGELERLKENAEVEIVKEANGEIKLNIRGPSWIIKRTESWNRNATENFS
jgi:GTP-binding protein HflX